MFVEYETPEGRDVLLYVIEDEGMGIILSCDASSTIFNGVVIEAAWRVAVTWGDWFIVSYIPRDVSKPKRNEMKAIAEMEYNSFLKRLGDLE